MVLPRHIPQVPKTDDESGEEECSSKSPLPAIFLVAGPSRDRRDGVRQFRINSRLNVVFAGKLELPSPRRFYR